LKKVDEKLAATVKEQRLKMRVSAYDFLLEDVQINAEIICVFNDKLLGVCHFDFIAGSFH